MKHIHILGIAGTFMGSLAVLAKQAGLTVTGSDAAIYPPMSTQLEEQGITLHEGYDSEQLDLFKPDLIVVGNAMKRGHPVIESLLNRGLPYTSGPQWLADAILPGRSVLACAGTHGKTTTTSMLAWILSEAGLNPGYLIGGVAKNFPASAALGDSPYFVIEADEYDSAFFDKRSKFIHYRPKTLILNNLEFDHADIFDDLAAIQKQFHHLIRTVPSEGRIIHQAGCQALDEVIAKGCWTPCQSVGLHPQSDWRARILADDYHAFEILYQGSVMGTVQWSLLGEHNVFNALAAIAAADHVGVSVETAIAALNTFEGVRRRLEFCGAVDGVTVYDDFAHHPTAIETTLNGLRQHVGQDSITAVLELGSFTMKAGEHRGKLTDALREADKVFVLNPNGELDLSELAERSVVTANTVPELVAQISNQVNREKEHIVVMSNKGFDGLQGKLLQALSYG